MIVTWHGGNCFRLEASGWQVLVDPETTEGGSRLKGDVVVRTESEPPFALGSLNEVRAPGEYGFREAKIRGVLVASASSPERLRTAYRIELDDIRFGFLGNATSPLAEDELEALGTIDVLFIPAHEKAADFAKAIEPKMVVPGAGDREKIARAFGQRPEPHEKLVLKRKDIEGEAGTKLIFLMG
ncbi:MAG: MBL fold metallo-hydrolase [Candidatus Colwellbacteria bacterium]|nr:MBL fold metallo-hydrolase [Candidatus Colwellbacteria bacterium]